MLGNVFWRVSSFVIFGHFYSVSFTTWGQCKLNFCFVFYFRYNMSTDVFLIYYVSIVPVQCVQWIKLLWNKSKFVSCLIGYISISRSLKEDHCLLGMSLFLWHSERPCPPQGQDLRGDREHPRSFPVPLPRLSQKINEYYRWINESAFWVKAQCSSHSCWKWHTHAKWPRMILRRVKSGGASLYHHSYLVLNITFKHCYVLNVD